MCLLLLLISQKNQSYKGALYLPLLLFSVGCCLSALGLESNEKLNQHILSIFLLHVVPLVFVYMLVFTYPHVGNQYKKNEVLFSCLSGRCQGSNIFLLLNCEIYDPKDDVLHSRPSRHSHHSRARLECLERKTKAKKMDDKLFTWRHGAS